MKTTNTNQAAGVAASSLTPPQQRAAALKRIQEEDPFLFDATRSKPETLLKRLTPKSKTEILNSGTPEEVGFLFSVLQKVTRVGGSEEDFYLWEPERTALQARIGEEGMRQANLIFAKIFCLQFMETDFERVFAEYERNATFLGRWAVQWREYEKQADELTELYKKGIFVESSLKTIIETLKFEWAELVFNKKEKRFSIEVGAVGTQGRLYSIIEDRKNLLLETMRKAKAMIEAAEQYIAKQGLKLSALPHLTGVYMWDMKSEDYFKHLYVGNSYLYSTLNENIYLKGMKEPKNKDRYIFPDYFDIEPPKERVELYKRDLETALKRYENLNYFDFI